jgi:hypothetical protein
MACLLIALGAGISSIPVRGDELFSAREFLLTREFKMGIDLFPQGAPVALSPSACLRVFEAQRPQLIENTRAGSRFRKFVVTHFLRPVP